MLIILCTDIILSLFVRSENCIHTFSYEFVGVIEKNEYDFKIKPNINIILL